MSDDDREQLRTRLAVIQRERKLKWLGGFLSSTAVAQLLFASFAFGHSRGPMPLTPLELVAGMGLALVFGVSLAFLTSRRRMEKRSSLVARLSEGRHTRRVAVFDDFFTIDQEVVLDGSIDRLDVQDDKLVLRYVDPRFDGPVLRELGGTPTVLEKLVNAVRA